MYEVIIKEYLKRLSLKDINDFANKNNVSLKPGEDKVLYNFIMNNWMEVYKGDSNKAFSKLKGKVSDETYNNGIKLFNEFKNKQFKNSLDKLLPQKLIPVIIEKSGINLDKKVNEINKKERHRLVNLLKNFEVTIKGFRPIDEAIITSGGINIKEINPKTMESKLVEGLYFAGEIIDVDAYTGGFNLQIAYSTGYVAGDKI